MTFLGHQTSVGDTISTHTLTWSVTLIDLGECTFFTISTHTLTWSVTSSFGGSSSVCTISTHTLTWSVTALLYLLVQFLCHFNSHAHVERDYLAVTFRIIAVISTHTLTWSVTRQVLPYTACRKFQLTRSRGAWPCPRRLIRRGARFQLTRSRGAWHLDYHGKLTTRNFNSHAHVERDFRHMTRNVHQVNFNSHAHVERDKIGLRPIQFFAISTHTLTWSVTGHTHTANARLPFQLTRSRGAWLVRCCLIQLVENFNSHAHVERDIGNNCSVLRYRNFNSHAHVERDSSGVALYSLSKISTHTLTWSVTFAVLFPLFFVEKFQLTRSRGAWHNATIKR